MNPGVRGFAPDALQAIDEARWPGNVRELENRIKRAVIMADGKLVMRDDLDMAGGGEDGEEAWLNLRSARERSEEHTSELQSLMRNSYAVFCLKKKNIYTSTI